MAKESAKILRKLGFPQTETAVTHASLLPRALGCLTRRLGKLEELVTEIKDLRKSKEKKEKNADQDDLANKTLDKNLGCIAVRRCC